MNAYPLCRTKHGFTGEFCVRPAAHDGDCWGAWEPQPHTQQLIRTEWMSERGAYVQHLRYNNLRAGNRVAQPMTGEGAE